MKSTFLDKESSGRNDDNKGQINTSSNKRKTKAKLKGLVTKQLQMLPQKIVLSNEKLNEMYMTEHAVSVENIEEPPDQFMKGTLYDISTPNDNGTGTNATVKQTQYGPKQTVRDKKVAMERDQLRERIFKLFEKAKGYTLEEVASILNQPRDPVKKTLEELCDINRNTREYELKQKFTH